MENLKDKKILMFHHWNYYQVSHFLSGTEHLYITSSPEKHKNVINIDIGHQVDVDTYNSFKPDIIIAKVDAFFNIVPVNLDSFKGPKLLILGDTQHGNNPLLNMINYAKSEKYDYYISDHKKHHLWYYQLAGLKNLYFIPGLFHRKYEPYHRLMNANTKKPVFVGQIGKHHPYRNTVLKYIDENTGITIDQCSPYEAQLYYQMAESCLNVSLNGDLNLRVFEILAQNGALITDRLSYESGLYDHMEEGVDLLSFDSKEKALECIEKFKLKEFRKNIKERSRITYEKHYSEKANLEKFNKIAFGRDAACNNTYRNNLDFAKKYSEERILKYQEIQEKHRKTERLNLDIDMSGEGNVYPEDYIDLPRCFMKIHNMETSRRFQFEKYLDKTNQKSRVEFQ